MNKSWQDCFNHATDLFQMSNPSKSQVTTTGSHQLRQQIKAFITSSMI